MKLWHGLEYSFAELFQGLNQQNLLVPLVSLESLGLNLDFQKQLEGLGQDLTWYKKFSSLEPAYKFVFGIFLGMFQVLEKNWSNFGTAVYSLKL